MGGDAADVHTAALEVNEEQHVVGHQSSKRENLDREEVGCREEGEVGPNEFRPGGRTSALGCGRYTVAAQHVADCLIGDMVSQIGERPDNPVIAPGAIFPGHANNQSLDVLVNSRSAGTLPRLRSVASPVLRRRTAVADSAWFSRFDFRRQDTRCAEVTPGPRFR